MIAAYTATATGQVKDDIIAVLGLRDPQLLISGFDRRNLYFGVETPKNKLNYVIQYIEGRPGDSGIVYCTTRKNVEKVHEALVSRGIGAARYHAGLSPQERSRNQEDFIYDRKPVIVALILLRLKLLIGWLIVQQILIHRHILTGKEHDTFRLRAVPPGAACLLQAR